MSSVLRVFNVLFTLVLMTISSTLLYSDVKDSNTFLFYVAINTAFIMCIMTIIPFLFVFREKHLLPYYKGKQICFINSIGMFVVSFLMCSIYSELSLVTIPAAIIYYFFNLSLYVDNNPEKREHSKGKWLLPLKIIMVILIIGIVACVITLFDSEKEEETQKTEIKYIDRTDPTYEEFYRDNIEKLEFYDNAIVFVIEGYGDYYFTYDQMQEVTDGEAFSYWAYNVEAAKGKGYVPYR